MMSDPKLDALLCAYNSSCPDPLTIEDLKRRYPKIPGKLLSTLGTKLEQLGLIEAVPQGGHVLTAAGREAYLDYQNEHD